MIRRLKKISNKVLGPWRRLLFLLLAGAIAPHAVNSAPQYQHLFDLQQADGLRLSLPSDVAVGPSGNIYVVDGGNHRLVVFSEDGEFEYAIGKRGKAASEFEGPLGLGLDREENLYVADTGNHRIQVFTAKGHFIREIAVVDGGKGQRPVDVVSSPDGKRIFVTTSKNHKILAYSRTGLLINEWGGKGNNPGEFRYPATLAQSDSRRLYIVDVLNSRVQLFDMEGKYITVAGDWGVLPGQLFRPKGVAIDSAENIYVSDSYLNVVQVFDDHMAFRHAFGTNNDGVNLNAPTGIAVDAERRLYVAEMLGNKVSVYERSD